MLGTFHPLFAAAPRFDRSPGPITANPASSMGRQVLSTKSSGSMLGFGSSKRLVEHATDVPGPGACGAAVPGGGG